MVTRERSTNLLNPTYDLVLGAIKGSRMTHEGDMGMISGIAVGADEEILVTFSDIKQTKERFNQALTQYITAEGYKVIPQNTPESLYNFDFSFNFEQPLLAAARGDEVMELLDKLRKAPPQILDQAMTSNSLQR